MRLTSIFLHSSRKHKTIVVTGINSITMASNLTINVFTAELVNEKCYFFFLIGSLQYKMFQKCNVLSYRYLYTEFC